MDIIGVLGEATDAVIGTYTAYICPSGKAAKVKLCYRGVAGINSTLKFVVNGIEIFTSGALTTGHVIYSSTAQMFNDAATAAAITGATAAATVGSGPNEYYLGPGDSITYTIATADFSSMKVTVVGTEVDIA